MKVSLFIYLFLLSACVLGQDDSSESGTSTITLSATIYDQAPAYMTHSNFPASWWTYPAGGWTDYPSDGNSGTANGSYGWSVSDFELPMWMYGTVRAVGAGGQAQLTNGEFGLVGNECNSTNNFQNCGQLGSDGTPVYAYTGRSPYGTVQGPDSFANWFHSTPASFAIPYNFVLSLVPGTASTFEYSNLTFFPIDGRGWNDQGWNGSMYHNYAFCSHGHAVFGYAGGEVFNFYGDDDMYVFIDGKLCIDLGGVHTQLAASIQLNNLPWLVKGKNYPFDMFYCERHTTDSNIQITTSIQFTCPTVLDNCGVCGGNGQSCCTTADQTACNDNNVCTFDTCGVTTPCQHIDTSYTCKLNVSCFIDSCDPINGCQHQPVNCNDNNACTLDACNNQTGCTHTPINCPSNQCYQGGCNPATGCTSTPISCGTSDKCTQYSCNNSTGCSTTTTNCNDNNACTIDSCDPVQGCQYKNVSCDDGLKCTVDTCNPSTGCVHTPVECTGTVCSTAQCDTSTGTCTYQNLTCADTSDCSVDVCSSPNKCYSPLKSCDTGGCTLVPKDCSTNNPCSIGSCVNATGECSVAEVNPNGFCLPCGANACTWTDPCNPMVCNSDMKCVVAPYNCSAPNACSTNKCVSSGTGQAAVASCSQAPVSCSNDVAADECTPIICDNKKGCINSTSNCQDYNPCTVDTCNGPNNCSNIVPADVCDDKNVCTVDSCNSTFSTLTQACQHTNITCTPPNACMVPSGCDPVNGCQFVPIVCPTPSAYCLTSYCDNTAGCVQLPRTCPVTDVNCYYGVCDNSSSSCSQKQRSNFATLTTNGGTCFFVYDKKTVAALTAGAIAGIVIAGAVVLAILAFGGKKGYDLWLAHNMSGTSGVKGNPLYAASNSAGTSPMYA